MQPHNKRSLLLAIDNVSLPLRRNLTLYITQPHIHEMPVLTPERGDQSRPDNLAALFYGTVIHDGGKFRMWYSPVGDGPDPTVPPELLGKIATVDVVLARSRPCYAESSDGLHWEKPILNQSDFRGNKAHNGLDMGFATTAGAAIIRDDQETDPMRRYKAIFSYYVYFGPESCASLGGATSPDGIHWTPGPLKPLNGDFFEATGFHRHGEMYVAIGQKTGPHYSENATLSSRQGRAHVSYKFNNWTIAQGEALLLPEPLDPTQRGGFSPYDQVHVGIGTANYNNVTVGLFGLWHNQPDFREVTCDLGLAISNDGLHFRQVVQGMPYIKHEDSRVAAKEISLPQSILTQGNGIVNAGDRTLIYHGRWNSGGIFGKPTAAGSYEAHLEHMDDYYSEIALAEIPRDRWGGLGVFPNANEGHVWTAPVRLPEKGFQLSLNAADVNGLKIDIMAENLQPFEEYQNGKCLEGDGLDSAVSWSQDVTKLAGQTVRFRVNFTRDENNEPRLFALNIDPTE